MYSYMIEWTSLVEIRLNIQLPVANVGLDHIKELPESKVEMKGGSTTFSDVHPKLLIF